jgi:ABC-type multidrug transport system ATPase subunit
MYIEFREVFKRYRFEWILKNFNYTFEQNKTYSISGANGSGKSTLIQLISASLSPSKGIISYNSDKKSIDVSNVYKNISFTAPYIDLIEELTLEESVNFHFQFKPLISGLNSLNFFEILELPKAARSKQIRFFSSGMKQRLKLCLSFLSDTSVLLLDEPTITLDKEGIKWYKRLLEIYAINKRLVVIASNVDVDIELCTNSINLSDYK